MKHYINFKDGDELDVFKAKRVVGFNSPRGRAKASRIKQGYRQRERAALGRMVEQLVVEEIGNRRSRSHWESELDDLFGELQALEAEEELALEHYYFFGYGYDKNWYKAKFDELFEQIDEANYQLSLFG